MAAPSRRVISSHFLRVGMRELAFALEYEPGCNRVADALADHPGARVRSLSLHATAEQLWRVDHAAGTPDALDAIEDAFLTGITNGSAGDTTEYVSGRMCRRRLVVFTSTRRTFSYIRLRARHAVLVRYGRSLRRRPVPRGRIVRSSLRVRPNRCGSRGRHF